MWHKERTNKYNHAEFIDGIDDGRARGGGIGVSGLDLFPLRGSDYISYNWHAMINAISRGNYNNIRLDFMGYSSVPWVSDYSFAKLWTNSFSRDTTLILSFRQRLPLLLLTHRNRLCSYLSQLHLRYLTDSSFF